MVGDITKKVRNRASPITTGFGGTVCPPKACRKKESTTTIRVKEVTIIKTAGKKERKLIIRNVSIKGLLMSLKSIACAGDAAAHIVIKREMMVITGLEKSVDNNLCIMHFK